jgi:proton-translocating NADH-quinone oxidoreductase chain N
MSNNPFLWLIAIPLISTPVIYLIGRVFGPGEECSKPCSSQYIALAALLATWIPYILSVSKVLANGFIEYSSQSIAFRIDGLSLLLAGLVLALATLVALYSGTYLAGEKEQEKYYALLVALVGIIAGLGMTNDLFNLWVWFEAMSISTYFLVTFYRKQPRSLEAGIKYLVQSALGSAMILLAIGLVLANTGTLNLDLIRQVSTKSPMLLIAGALFILGFGVKSAMVPMHTWLPDAHSVAPSGISAMLSGVIIEAGLIAMLRALSALGLMASEWGIILMAFGAANMLFGNLMALSQTQVKRLLAFSSLSQMGYVFIGLGLGIYANVINGVRGGLFHILTHGMMKGLAFLAAGSLLYALHIAAGDHMPLTKSDICGAARRYPLSALALSIAVLGLGCMPPLAGFWSKMQIFLAGFETQQGWIIALIIFAGLNSLLSFGYYAPLVIAVYRREPSELVQNGHPLSLGIQAPLLLLSVAIIVVGLWPNLLTWITRPAAAGLMMTFGG